MNTNTITGFMLVAFVLGALGGSMTAIKHMQIEAIDRGYALHCPNDGEFEWKGECNE